jgi:hypothetical protein
MTPTGAAFDIVLLLHVAAVVLGLGAVVVSGVQAARVLAAGRVGPSPTLAAYFAPSVNWVGRVLYAVPVLGVVLLAISRGAYGWGDAWVQWGIGLWVAAAAGAEGLLWPSERRIGAGLGDPAAPELRRACRRACAAAAGLVAVLVLAVVLMVAQP